MLSQHYSCWFCDLPPTSPLESGTPLPANFSTDWGGDQTREQVLSASSSANPVGTRQVGQCLLTASVRSGLYRACVQKLTWRGPGGVGAPSPPRLSVAWQPHPLCPHRRQGHEGSPCPSTLDGPGSLGWRTQRSDQGTARSPGIRCRAYRKMQTQALFLKNYSEFQDGKGRAWNQVWGPPGPHRARHPERCPARRCLPSGLHPPRGSLAEMPTPRRMSSQPR